MTPSEAPFSVAWTQWRTKGGKRPVIDETEIKRWIARLETEDSSWTNYERLAVLYTVINHQNDKNDRPEAQLYSAAPAPVEVFGDSDFLQAVSSVEPSVAWAIMDELMDSLKVVNERVYNSVMRKLYR